jgi:hypothetical protein
MGHVGDIALWICGKGLWWLFVLTVLSNARCATTTRADPGTNLSVLAPPVERWLDEHQSSSALIVLRDGPEGEPRQGVLAHDARSFATVPGADLHLLSPTGAETIPLARVRQVRVLRRGRGALEGALIGAGVGILTGVVLGLAAGDSRNREDCGYPCTAGEKAKLAGLVFGGLGTAAGALLGTAIGHRDVLAF